MSRSRERGITPLRQFDLSLTNGVSISERSSVMMEPFSVLMLSKEPSDVMLMKI